MVRGFPTHISMLGDFAGFLPLVIDSYPALNLSGPKKLNLTDIKRNG